MIRIIFWGRDTKYPECKRVEDIKEVKKISKSMKKVMEEFLSQNSSNEITQEEV
jgi:hypothetical protein